MKATLIVGCLVAFSWAVVGQEQATAITSEQYQEGYAIGVDEARKQLKSGNATLYTCGLRQLPEFLDRETGLPCDVIAGCVVDNEIRGRQAGHNDTIRKFIAERGLPANSFKRWNKDLFDLKGFYEKRAGTERPVQLIRGDLAAECPDGIHELRLEKIQHRKEDGTLSVRSAVVISVAGVDHKALHLWFDGDMDLFWGPKGSGFAVIRCVQGQKQWFTALDLRRGKILRNEYASE